MEQKSYIWEITLDAKDMKVHFFCKNCYRDNIKNSVELKLIKREGSAVNTKPGETKILFLKCPQCKKESIVKQKLIQEGS